MNRDEPEIKLVPFIDILFTLLIFLVVTSTFGAASVTGDDTGTGTGKPNMTDSTGDAEGDVQIKTSEHAIYIQAPPGMTPQQAVHKPE